MPNDDINDFQMLLEEICTAFWTERMKTELTKPRPAPVRTMAAITKGRFVDREAALRRARSHWLGVQFVALPLRTIRSSVLFLLCVVSER